MAVEKFFQRLRSGEAPKGNRSRNQGPITDAEDIGFRQMLPSIAQKEQAPRAKVVPLYGGTALTRSFRIWMGKKSSPKAAHHPMGGFLDPVFGGREDK